jgi:hypothetical protein
MSFQYEILFQADMLHSYFDSGMAKDIGFKPTLQCASLLKDYRLNFKNTSNGFLLIAEQITNDGVNWVQAAPIDVGQSFNFFAFSSRSDLLNITDANLSNFSAGRKFFFGNNAATPTTATPPARLSFDIWNGATLTSGVSLGSTNFVAAVNKSLNPFWLVMLDANANIISKTFIARNSANEIIYDKVLLTEQPLPEDIYTLQQTDALGNVLSSESFFLTDSAADVSTIGIFQIRYNAAVDAAVTAGDEIHFTAKLAARKIKWVYRIEVDQYSLPTEIPNNYNPAMLCLNSVTNTVPVLGPFTPNILPGTPTVVSFESNSAIALKESPYIGVSLQDKTNAPALNTIINNLPNPSPQLLGDAGPGNYKAEVSLKIK